jgi:Protein ENHANCED DISEASE RESISTANCE 2, C-terminal
MSLLATGGNSESNINWPSPMDDVDLVDPTILPMTSNSKDFSENSSPPERKKEKKERKDKKEKKERKDKKEKKEKRLSEERSRSRMANDRILDELGEDIVIQPEALYFHEERKLKKEKEKRSSSDRHSGGRSGAERGSSRKVKDIEHVEDSCTSDNLHADENELAVTQRSMLRPSTSANQFYDVTSPSAVCRTRRHSPVIMTNLESSHELSHGRPMIVIPLVPGERKSNSFNGSRLIEVEKDDVDGLRLTDDEPESNTFFLDPQALRPDAWSEPLGTSFQVRSEKYLNNKEKVNSDPSVFRLLTVDLVQSAMPLMTGLCSHKDERIQRALHREKSTGKMQIPEFVFAVNLLLPSGNTFYHAVFYFGIDDISIIKDTRTPLGKVAKQFFFGDSDEFRNNTFKLIPRIAEGNFVVRKAVGSKPAILGRKIKQTYIRSPRFMELIVDIASDTVANKIVALSLGYAKTLTVDMAFLLEAKDQSMLPERVLGAVCMNHIDFKSQDGQRQISR